MNMFKPTAAKTPEEYIRMIDEPRRSEVKELYDFIRATVPKCAPYIESGMIGFGKYHYVYPSGREGDWMLIGLASQKNYISLYVCAVVDGGQYVAEKYKAKLSKASIGKSCIHVKHASDIDKKVLADILRDAVKAGGMGEKR